MKWPGMGEYGDVNEEEGAVYLPFSQVWESFMPKLEYRHVLGSKRYSCPHTEGGEVERVLVMFNESGCNSTGICLDCLMEWVERNSSRIWGVSRVKIKRVRVATPPVFDFDE